MKLPVISIKRVAVSEPVITGNQAGPVIFLEPVADKGRRLAPSARPCTPVTGLSTQTAQPSDMPARVPSFVDYQKQSRISRFDCSGSTSFVLRHQFLICSDRRNSSEQLNSPKSSRRTTPSTPQDRSPRQRPFPLSVAVPHTGDRSAFNQKAVHGPMHRTVYSGGTHTSESASSSGLSSSDTARTVIYSGPATPRIRSGGADSTSSGGDIACIADALRGKLERALSASLAEVRDTCCNDV
jgi:hypothetical protein